MSTISSYAFIIGVMFAFVPNLILHGAELWEQEQYQYFPFVYVAVIYLWWSRCNDATPVEVPKNSARRPFIPYAIVAVAISLLTIAIYCQWAWLSAVAFILLLSALVDQITQRYRIRNAWGIWLLTWLIVPPPIEFGVVLVQRLQLLSSRLSSSILDMSGVLHILEGNVLSLPDKQLFVDEACSGIVSVMSVVAVVAIFAVWANRSLLHFLALLFAGILWAVTMNTARICIVAVAEARYGLNLAEGTAHDVLGLVLFVVTFVAVLSTDRLLSFVLSPISVADFGGEANTSVLIRMWNSSVTLLAPIASAEQGNANGISWRPETFYCLPGKSNQVLAIILLVSGFWTTLVQAGIVGTPAPILTAADVESSINEGTLAATIGKWQLQDFQDVEREAGNVNRGTEFGRFSKQFTYSNGDISAIVSIDFPFKGGWHELSACYRMVGWEVTDRTVRQDKSGGLVATDLRKGDDVLGYLLFSNFSDNGAVLSPASRAVLSRSWFFVRRRLLREISRNVYQTQVFVTANRELQPEERNSLFNLFEHANAEFIRQIRVIGTNPSKKPRNTHQESSKEDL